MTNTDQAKPIRPAFMDAVEAAANLKTDRLTVLEYIKEGKLKTFGGKPGNPFVRTDDVDKLVAAVFPAMELEEAPKVDPKTVHRNDPVRKVKLRIQQDAKWPEISETGMRAWANEIDTISFGRMRKVAEDTISQLQLLIKVIDEVEAQRKSE
jgi:uridylate kinase